MDPHLEELLRSIIGADPSVVLDDEKRKAITYAMLGMQSAANLEAVFGFVSSIQDEAKRSILLHALVPRFASVLQHKRAKEIADSIPVPYWRWTSVINIASDLLERDRATGGPNTGFRREAIELIREAEQSLPLVAEEDGDRATIVWRAGLALVKAGELDWAEALAESSTYCAEHTEVLLRIAKDRASRGEAERARKILHRVANLARSGENDLTNRAFDLQEAGELAAELGEEASGRQYLDAALAIALKSQGQDIDGAKCVGAIALSLAKQGSIEVAREAAGKITQRIRRERTLQSILEMSQNTKRK